MQQLELTTEDREDHTFNGARFQYSRRLSFFFYLFSFRDNKLDPTRA